MAKSRLKDKMNEDMLNKIYTLYENDSYSVAEVCEAVGIAPSTFYAFKAENKHFKDGILNAIARFYEKMDVVASRSLKRKLEGYEYTEEHVTSKNIEVGKDDKGLKVFKPIVTEKKTVKKHVQPSDLLIIFTKKNLDERRFAEKQNVSITHEQPLFGADTDIEDLL